MDHIKIDVTKRPKAGVWFQKNTQKLNISEEGLDVGPSP